MPQTEMMFFRIVGFLLLLNYSCTGPNLKNKQNKTNFTIGQLKSPTNSSLRGISVLDSSNAWLSGANGTILRTSNGGQLWKLCSPPDLDSLDFRSIVAFNAKEALIASAGFPSRVYKTIDGGANWLLVHENIDSAAFMNSIAFKNAKEGIIIGDQLNGRHLILRTSDRGLSWERMDSSNIPVPLSNENGFAASGSCIAISSKGNYLIALGGGHSRIFTSPNGTQWEATESKLKCNGPTSGIYSIAAAPHTHMVVGGDFTQVDSLHQASISNDGIQWKRSEGYLNGYRSVVDYSESCKCWLAAGTNGVDVSYDNGESWEFIAEKDINTLRFVPNTSRVFLATKNGEIFTLNLD